MPDMTRHVVPRGSPFSWSMTEAQLGRLSVVGEVAEVVLETEIMSPPVQRALLHRRAFEEAREAAARLLVLEAGCLLSPDAGAVLQRVLAELGERRWDVIHLGAATRGVEPVPAAGLTHVVAAGTATAMFANVYAADALEALLSLLPADPAAMADWLGARQAPFEDIMLELPDRYLAQPVVACVPELLPYLDPSRRDGFVEGVTLSGPVVAPAADRAADDA